MTSTIPLGVGKGADLRALLEKATEGPWRAVSADDYQIAAAAYPASYPHRFPGDDTGSALAVFGNRPADFGEANRNLVVAAVNALPALLDEIEAKEHEHYETSTQWRSQFDAMQHRAMKAETRVAELETLLAASPEDPAACPNCNGRLWVCENHPTQTNWEECCGVGMMCGVCCREEIIRGAVFHAERRVAELVKVLEAELASVQSDTSWAEGGELERLIARRDRIERAISQSPSQGDAS